MSISTLISLRNVLTGLVLTLSLAGVGNAAEPVSSGKAQVPVAKQDADPAGIATLGGVTPNNGTSYGAIYGYTYRQDWGYRNGQWILDLNWCAVSPSSKVFVSISEADSSGTPFIGAARFTVHNVAPQSCHVKAWVNIEWGSPIHLVANYTILP